MDYFLILVLWIIGVGFDVMRKITKLRKKFPQFGFGTVWKTFFGQEWDSLMVSVLVLLFQETALIIIAYNEIKLPPWFDAWGMYVLSLALNYSGQRTAYHFLNTSESVLKSKADELKLTFDKINHKPKTSSE